MLPSLSILAETDLLKKKSPAIAAAGDQKSIKNN